MTTPRALACAAVVGFSLLAVPTAAGADGPPIGFLSPDGVASGQVRYVALPAGRGTLLEKLSLTTAKPLRTHSLGGRVGVPVIASDGTAGGLSHDGGTLVLGAERTTYPQVKSTLYVMNTGNLSLRRRIHLEGDFSFDAISPDGATIYLIQLDPRDFTHYAVRAFDTASWRLDPKPVVDRREPDEAMRGYPMTRVTSPDGRFAYTLYIGGEKPFVHALDTMRRSSACIDLPPLPNTSQFALRLKGRQLTVVVDGAPVALVNTATRHVAKPGAAHPAAQPSPGDDGGPNVATWVIVAGAAAALAAAAA